MIFPNCVEVSKNKAKPAIAIEQCMRSPIDIPSEAKAPALLPSLRAILRISIKSGPGVNCPASMTNAKNM